MIAALLVLIILVPAILALNIGPIIALVSGCGVAVYVEKRQRYNLLIPIWGVGALVWLSGACDIYVFGTLILGSLMFMFYN